MNKQNTDLEEMYYFWARRKSEFNKKDFLAQDFDDCSLLYCKATHRLMLHEEYLKNWYVLTELDLSDPFLRVKMWFDYDVRCKYTLDIAQEAYPLDMERAQRICEILKWYKKVFNSY